MKHWVFVLLIIGVCHSASAQFGITMKQNFNDFPTWDERATAALRNDVNIFPQGLELGFDYWFRLTDKRIEFLPQLAISRFSTNISGDDFVDGYILNRAHFNFNTNIYFLDFASDCDCPTFSKQGNFLTKGLFLQISPGVVYSRELMNYVNMNSTGLSDYDLRTNISYKIGVGIGLDIGFTDLFTITPMAGFNYYPAVNWENFDLLHYDATIGSSTPNKTSIREIQVGIRLGFRPDYNRR